MEKNQDPKAFQELVNRTLWEACDTFRGVVDPAEYKNYILVFMFLKYLSDVWRDKRAAYLEEYNNDEALVARKMRRERFVLPEGCSFYDLHQARNEPNIGDRINKALEKIEDENKAKLEGVFRNVDFNSEANLGRTQDRNRRLKNLLQDFNKDILDFRPSEIGTADVIGNAYMYLIEKFASDAGKKGGEFFSPQGVSTLLARLLKPQPGARIADPACGSGSLLVTVAEQVGSRDFALYGQESNGSTWALCKMNMFLHQMDAARIEWGDTINYPRLIEEDRLMKFDIVVANPPFSLEKWGAENAENDPYQRFERGIPPKTKGDYAFILHMIETATQPHGRVGVIVPHGVLFRSSSEGRIREKLIEENLLSAVIGLPANLFFGTGIPAAIMIFDRAKAHQDVLFIDASAHYGTSKKQNELRPEDLERIMQVYDTYLQGEPLPPDAEAGRVLQDKFAYRAPLPELRANEYNLNIPRYVDTFEPEPRVDLAAAQQEIEAIEHELVGIRQEMKQHLKNLGL